MARRKVRNLARRPPKKEAYKTILIVCEGEKTEKLYFESLVLYEKLSSVNIQIYSGRGSDPKSVVETAIQKMDEQSQYLHFDEVYCVIDRDTHSTFNDAQQLAKKHGINMIISYPSFEYWYLCHFIYSTAPIMQSGSRSAGDCCVALLNTPWHRAFNEPYHKSKSGIYIMLLPYLDEAIKNANRALNESLERGSPNPSTQVHLLVEVLRHIKA